MQQQSICFCNSTLAWGGGEKWHLEAALSLAARGWRVSLLCHPKGELYKAAQQHPGLHCIPMRINRYTFLCPWVRAKLKTLFRSLKPRAVIMNLPSDLKAIAPAAHAAQVPCIIYRRGSAINVKNSWLNRKNYRLLTHLIVNSTATRQAIFANNPQLIDPAKVHYIPNGIDSSTFLAKLQQAPKSTLFSHIPASTCVIGTAGRLSTQKAQEYLLYLAQDLLEKKVDAHIIIAGTGKREQELKALAQELGVCPMVTFTGFLSDLTPFWQRIDIFALTSLWEGFGYVLIEAMLAKKPIVAFAVSNIPELVHDGVNGMLFPLPHNATAHAMAPMAKAISTLAAQPEKQTQMGEAGYSFARNNFAHEAMMDKLEQLLAYACPS